MSFKKNLPKLFENVGYHFIYVKFEEIKHKTAIVSKSRKIDASEQKMYNVTVLICNIQTKICNVTALITFKQKNVISQS